jgi:hypothetical protein
MSQLAKAADRALGRAADAYREQLLAEQEALADAVAAKRPLANHYWQGRHQAEQRLRAALAICAAIKIEEEG